MKDLKRYVRQQEDVVEYLRGNQLHLSGDGRCDSPGTYINNRLNTTYFLHLLHTYSNCQIEVSLPIEHGQ